MRKQMLHLGTSNSKMPESGPFIDELKQLGDLTIVRNGEQLSDEERAALIRDCHILLTMWGSAPVPDDIARDRGKLEYICNITGEMTRWISLDIIDSGIPVTNWGDAPADAVAEAAMTLLLQAIKDVRPQNKHMEQGGWRLINGVQRGLVKGLPVGIYGMGAIGRRFVELIRPFGAELAVYDPFVAELPEGCARVGSLEELFDRSLAIVIHAALTEQTRGTVTAELLARLPDHAIVINTARGAIIDQDALFAELESGRLRAGLDVLAGSDSLEPGHPARQWSNLSMTAHSLDIINWNLPRLLRREEICLDNIRRHLNGEPLRFRMDRARYLLST
ncbi:NAD(P)-dependent oxidoreductase [Paenibacillus sp. GYB003]|uniref:NAD(P)-dependent oxidoreductase n=1 Tax=Paenibacillus sp. GYB003 TaxID=2994392 RepID=UPI002F96468D